MEPDSKNLARLKNQYLTFVETKFSQLGETTAISVLSAGKVLDSYSTWLSALTGGILAVVITKASTLSSIVDATTFTKSLTFLVFAGCSGFICKYFIFLSGTTLAVAKEMRAPAFQIFEDIHAEKERITNEAHSYNQTIALPDFDPEQLLGKIKFYLPRVLHPMFEKNFKRGMTDQGYWTRRAARNWLIAQVALFFQMMFFILFFYFFVRSMTSVGLVK